VCFVSPHKFMRIFIELKKGVKILQKIVANFLVEFVDGLENKKKGI